MVKQMRERSPFLNDSQWLSRCGFRAASLLERAAIASACAVGLISRFRPAYLVRFLFPLSSPSTEERLEKRRREKRHRFLRALAAHFASRATVWPANGKS